MRCKSHDVSKMVVKVHRREEWVVAKGGAVNSPYCEVLELHLGSKVFDESVEKYHCYIG